MPGTGTEQLIARHIEPIADRLRTLQRLLRVLGQDLAQEAQLAVVFEETVDRDQNVQGYRELEAGLSRRRAIEAMVQIDYGMSDAVNQSVKCYGALGVPKSLIQDGRRINRAKSEFKDALRSVAGKRVRVATRNPQGEPQVQMKALSNVILRRIQSSSINLLAAYRDIPLLDETPQAIRLMRTHTRSVPRKTAAALLALLDGRDDTLAQDDRTRLAQLDPKEYLVSPKERYPRMRAHVFYRRLDATGQPVRNIVMAELPILYPIAKSTRPPDIHQPRIRAKTRERPPSFIEPEEYVRTLHYRRMQSGHRQYAEHKRDSKNPAA